MSLAELAVRFCSFTAAGDGVSWRREKERIHEIESRAELHPREFIASLRTSLPAMPM